MKYDIQFKNGSYIYVDVEEDQPAPTLVIDPVTYFPAVINLPDGYSVDAHQVLYIVPLED